jgi:hypothetical protein
VTNITDMTFALDKNEFVMHLRSKIRRPTSVVLTLFLLLWAGAGTSASAASERSHACHSGTMHLQRSSALRAGELSQRCCPQHGASPSFSEETTHTASLNCQQDCCKLDGQPSRIPAYLASGNQKLPYSAAPSANRIFGERRAACAVASATIPLFTKTVFDLKADLRI